MEDGVIFHLFTVEKFIVSAPEIDIIDHGVQLLKNIMANGETVKVRMKFGIDLKQVASDYRYIAQFMTSRKNRSWQGLLKSKKKIGGNHALCRHHK